MTAELMRPAAAEFLRAGLAVDDLSAATPCDGYDVRGLLNHLLYWGPWLIAAGRREEAPSPGAGEADAALVTADWAAALEKQTETLVEVFAAPSAWTGVTKLGTAELPSAVVGAMVLGEFVLHGWDLATATGRSLHCAPAAATAVWESAVAMGDQARSMGVYGPEVPVPADAAPLDRALGAAGRDPSWRR
ncbi:TIGR03086 family metal-binding protein [Amycolatopsis sp., V23-08]|uniref:TIGR03086 family metal-binding protein n=1 Tax=Amycolatopsis heterodermiae TaxID=3110235 RepID=A0ABU5QZ61_9PSEU|nr:TIGR03086 family metal-binding protein [Amycolatopsis sp., V23-08]MEA5359212.1 TIGR03086 family metal-binding protein [Amycolatopsis sp., V23-08]